jgi:hypothetical protein
MHGAIGVEGEGPTVALEVVEDELAVGRTRLAGDEAGHEQPVGGVVDGFDQAEAAGITVLEPGVIRGVELDELSQGGPARSGLAVTRLAAVNLPQPRLDHPAPETVRIERTDLKIAREVLGQERGAEIMEERLPGPLQGAVADRIGDAVIGGTSPRSMDHSLVPLRFEAAEQPPEVAPTESHSLGTPARSQRAFGYPTQHHEAITIPQTQCEHLLPRRCLSASAETNRIRRRTFLLQPGGTFLLQLYTGKQRNLRCGANLHILWVLNQPPAYLSKHLFPGIDAS